MSINSALPGSLAWPGDLQLLEKYGVTINEISEKLISIIKDTKTPVKDKIEDYKKRNATTRSTCVALKSGDKFEGYVKLYLMNTKEIDCAYCHKKKEHNADYVIINNYTEEQISIPNVMTHLLKHQDLGDPGTYRINPTQICKVLELGNTSLSEDDPLLQNVRDGNLNQDQINQKKIDDATLEKLGVSAQEISVCLDDLINKTDEKLRLDIHQKTLIIDERFSICWSRFMGYQHCGLCEPVKDLGGYGRGIITNIKTDKSIPISTLMQHTISVHGYFSRDPEYRIDPELAFEVLEISKNKI